MGRRSKGFTRNTLERWLKEGRGQGDNETYQPWLKVQDFSSHGQSNRDFGLTTQRQHDYFSNIEFHYHLALDWVGVVDFQEQFPLLPLEKTIAIAHECGIRHPVDTKTRELIVMTSDFRIVLPEAIGTSIKVRAVKPLSKLKGKRVIEKLEIERRYWELISTECGSVIDWGIVTERELDPILTKNLLWSYKFKDVSALSGLTEELIKRISNLLTEKVLNVEAPLSTLALECDDMLGLSSGWSLSVARHLIANKWWLVDMAKLINPRDPLLLLSADLGAMTIAKTST